LATVSERGVLCSGLEGAHAGEVLCEQEGEVLCSGVGEELVGEELCEWEGEVEFVWIYSLEQSGMAWWK
jgi:hypothetical protein